ncbi:MAG: sodium:alanine symporter family protein [Clostridiales bacterium]|nr:sodium:alanine symporter family protein [Clostridiales bacterium]
MWDKIVAWIEKANSKLNEIVWGWPMIILILGVGLLITIRTRVMQVRKFGTSWKETIIPTVKSIGKKKKGLSKKENSVSQFEAFATAISGTVGTGNIVGVTSAIMTGGPGAVFWMWISAFFGMITNYAENVLGLYFRKKEKNGEFSGGPAYYLSEGLGRDQKGKTGTFLKTFGKILGVMAAVFCTFAAIGMSGVQTNKISSTFQEVMPGNNDTIGLVVGIVVAVVLALIILGGIKSIGRVTSILVPFMSLIFIVMALIIIFANVTMIGTAFAMIFGNIFEFESVVGGVGGYAFAQIIQKGLARGVFSNEAGLGSSVIAHSASVTREPVKQGLWGIFEVFFDTFIICTLTALVILVTFGNDKLVLFAKNPAADTAVSMGAFGEMFGKFGETVYSIILPLFAFTTILAWSYYGEKSVEFLFRKTGEKGRKIARTVFKVLYVLLVVASARIDGELAWAISDTFNGLMALPNLIGLVFMSGLVWRISKNYFDRKKGKNVKPMLSVYDDQNEEFISELAEMDEEKVTHTAESEEAAASEQAPAENE